MLSGFASCKAHRSCLILFGIHERMDSVGECRGRWAHENIADYELPIEGLSELGAS